MTIEELNKANSLKREIDEWEKEIDVLEMAKNGITDLNVHCDKRYFDANIAARDCDITLMLAWRRDKLRELQEELEKM